MYRHLIDILLKSDVFDELYPHSMYILYHHIPQILNLAASSQSLEHYWGPTLVLDGKTILTKHHRSSLRCSKIFKLGASGALTLLSPVSCGIYTPFSNDVTGLSSLFAIYSEINHLSPREEADALHYIN